MRYTFKVNERLKREQHINTLFRTGKAFSVFPVKVVYLLVPAGPDVDSKVQAGFSVPKKKFKKSVDRHRVRRLMVEVWRTNKHLIFPHVPEGLQLHVFVLFLGSELPVYEQVFSSLLKCIERVIEKIGPSRDTVKLAGNV